MLHGRDAHGDYERSDGARAERAQDAIGARGRACTSAKRADEDVDVGRKGVWLLHLR